MNHIDAALLQSRVWAIEPSAAAALEAQLNSAHRLAPHRDPATPVPSPFAGISAYDDYEGYSSSRSSSDKPYEIVNGVALIATLSVMTKTPSYWYGGTSTKLTQMAVRHAARDEDVKAIFMLWDTPGGSVDGLQELYDEIVAARAKKPVTSYWEDNCFSAGCYCSFASGKVLMNAAGYCGSLGSMLVLRDASQMVEQMGLHFELISTGKLKGQGSFGVPISPEGIAMFTRMVDHYGDNFRAAIASGRGLAEKAVDEIFTGDTFSAAQAQRLGLIDGIASIDDAFSDVLAQIEANAGEGDGSLVTRGASVTAPKPAASVTAPAPTISAPGGQPGSAGISTAPSSGAENQKGTPRMSFRLSFINNMAVKGYGKMVAALNGTTSEDPEVLGRIVTEQVEAQAADLVDRHPLITVAKAHGVTDLESFNALMDRARNGDQYLADVRHEARTEAVRAFGPETGPMIGASVDQQNLPQAIASRNAWRQAADGRVGIGANGEAPKRQTAPSGTVPVAKDVEQVGTRPFDKVSAEDQAKIRAQVGDDKVRQDRMAEYVLRGEA